MAARLLSLWPFPMGFLPVSVLPLGDSLLFLPAFITKVAVPGVVQFVSLDFSLNEALVSNAPLPDPVSD